MTESDLAERPAPKIDFAAIQGKDSAPAGFADSLISQADITNLKKFSARDQLAPNQLAEVQRIAGEEYPKMLDDWNVLASFGLPALSRVREVVSEMLEIQRKVEIPVEVLNYLKDMNDAVNGFRRKNRKSNPKIEEALRRFVDVVQGAFNAGRNVIEDMYFDSKSTETKLDGIAAKIVVKQMNLQKSVGLCGELYDANEVAIPNLLGVIAVLEQIGDLAVADAKQHQQNIADMAEGSPGRRRLEEELSNLTEFVDQLEIRKNELIQQFYSATSTSPQIRNIRRVSNGLSMRLGLLVDITIPELKKQIAILGSIIQAEEAGKIIEAIDEATNKAIRDTAEAAKTAIPEAQKIIEKPTLAVETIFAVMDSIVAQNKGIADAIEQGQVEKAKVVDAIVTASSAISASQEELSARVVDLVTRAKEAQKPQELPAPELPEAVLEAADRT